MERPSKTGILLMNMGGPRDLDEVEPFLTRLFTDKDIIPLPAQSTLGPLIAKRRTPSIRAKYAEIGGGSPIYKWTEIQGKLLVERLDKLSPETGPHQAFIGFRYAKPLTEDTLDEMEKSGIQRAIAFSQYPQYSCATAGSSFNAMAKYYHQASKKGQTSRLNWSFIDRWPINDGLVAAFTDRIRKELLAFPVEVRDKVVLLFSAHSLPLKAVSNGDPYPTEVGATVLSVMKKLGWSHQYRLVWQSKVGPVPWLSPQTDAALERLVKRGHKHLLIVPISFVNEHIETLHELDIEYAKELGDKVGAEMIRRAPAPNDHPLFIEGMANVVLEHLRSKKAVPSQLLLRCPMCTKQSCALLRTWLTDSL